MSELLRAHFTCDGHADTFRNIALQGGDFLSPEGTNHLNLPRLQAAHCNLQLMAAYTSVSEVAGDGTTIALRILAEAWRAAERSQGRLGIMRTAGDLERSTREDRPWILLTLEGADPLQSDLRLLETFHRLGLRSIGLTHNHNSCAAGGCDPPDGLRVGLTAFGRELLDEMRRLGMLVDVAHLGRRAFDEVMAHHKGPVVNSHACCQRFVPLERNLDEDQLRALAASRGLAGITFVPRFLTEEERQVSSHDVFRHLEHMVEIAGIDHVGIGSDFDGVGELPTDLNRPEELSALCQRMQEAGWSETDAGKVLGGNWRRVLSEVLPSKEE